MSQTVQNKNRPLGSDLSSDQLEQAISKADIRVLLMTLYHLTADQRWLSPPYCPKLDRKLIANEEAGLAPHLIEEIQRAAVDALSSGSSRPEITDPGNTQMQKMMSHCLGENVPEEYAPMMREEMGFSSRYQNASSSKNPAAFFTEPVLIVGAGASGIALAAGLQKSGIPFIILEKNSEAGGTWFNNIYPGCGVDTPSHAYSFSFGQRHNWSRYFSPQREIQDYLVRKTDELKIRPHIHFDTKVTSMDWLETKQLWSIKAVSGGTEKQFLATAVVSAIGQLNAPSVPSIPGREQFSGKIFHSAEWPENLDLTGKSVSVIGTGASAMQIVPTIAPDVKALNIYQRSAQWARPVPRYHDPIEEEAQWLLDTIPFYAAWFRFTMLWRYGDGLLPTLRKDPDWPHPEISVNRHNDKHRQELTEHIRNELNGDEELIKKCLPTYPPYGKRILLDNGWYGALRRDHVTLISDPVQEISPSGIMTADGKSRPADIIVFATGFHVTQMAARLNVTGRDALKLQDAWAPDNPRAYLGITVPSFPNFFCMQGPNTGLGHGGSAIFQAECQARYIIDCLQQMADEQIMSVDVKPSVHDAYISDVDEAHENLIWTHQGMSTYYRNSSNRVVSVMPWRLVDYWQMTRRANLSNYRLTR